MNITPISSLNSDPNLIHVQTQNPDMPSTATTPSIVEFDERRRGEEEAKRATDTLRAKKVAEEEARIATEREQKALHSLERDMKSAMSYKELTEKHGAEAIKTYCESI